jgi:hypothetical protein
VYVGSPEGCQWLPVAASGCQSCRSHGTLWDRLLMCAPNPHSLPCPQSPEILRNLPSSLVIT